MSSNNQITMHEINKYQPLYQIISGIGKKLQLEMHHISMMITQAHYVILKTRRGRIYCTDLRVSIRQQANTGETTSPIS